MVAIADDLTWQIVRSHNAAAVKRNGITLTREANNLMNVPSRTFSGLANTSAVGVEFSKDRKAAVLFLKTKDASSKPKRASKAALLKTQGSGPRRCIQVAQKLVGDQYYRDEHTVIAKARVSKLAQAISRKANGVKFSPKK